MNWFETHACPKCGLTMTEEPWWDDPPELGGACIGTMWVCTDECGECIAL